MIREGVNVNQTFDWVGGVFLAHIQLDNTPLHRAALHGRDAVACLLLDAGANLNARNKVCTKLSLRGLCGGGG